MKALIILVMAFAVYWVGKSVFDQYKAKQAKDNPAAAAPQQQAQLDGLPPQFEASLQHAESQGAPALKTWLQRNRKYVRDPRLAEIELNYVVLVSRMNPAEAKQVFQSVKKRTPKTSPLYDRIKRLDATYGN
jgi:hypothetical protein